MAKISLRLKSLGVACLFALLAAPVFAAETGIPSGTPEIKIRPKRADYAEVFASTLLKPDVSLIDTPTSAVLDYMGFMSASRFFSTGGFLQTLSFGVFNRLNIGASANVDKLIGSDKPTRLRNPEVQVKYRFYDGDRMIPSFAVGYDGQGYLYSATEKRYHHRHRGIYVVASQEIGIPGLMAHPSLNMSNFNSNSVFASVPFSFNVRDKVLLMLEWDNINNFADSRINTGLRIYASEALHLDIALRALGHGGRFPDGQNRGTERIVQLRYDANF